MADVFVNLFSKSGTEQERDIKQSDFGFIWKVFLSKKT